MNEEIKKITSQLYFRQSMVNDYLTCPQMFLYRWILNIEQQTQWFAAFLGTAGHAVISSMHINNNLDHDFMTILDMFETEFRNAVSDSDEDPTISASFDSIEDQLQSNAMKYTGYIEEYQNDYRNRDFNSVINEQSFVLPMKLGSVLDDSSEILFTGTIDQAGYYDDGTFALRDLKFRDAAFCPSQTELDINIQLTVYSHALKNGHPSCDKCKPFIKADGKLSYSGPCSDCIKKKKTKLWPQRYPERCELIWMKEYERYKKDKYAKTIKDPKKAREFNWETGRNKIREIPNPRYEEGYKAGDRKGKVFHTTVRTPSHIEVLMKDIFNIVHAMREGIFYRKPGSHCSSWCQYRDHCTAAKDIEITEIQELKEYPYED